MKPVVIAAVALLPTLAVAQPVRDFATVYGARPGTPRSQPRVQAETSESAPESSAPRPQQPSTPSAREDARSGPAAVDLAEGFFFDNYGSGSGFGVTGGDPVSSGSGSPLNLPSAGARARQLLTPPGSVPAAPPAATPAAASRPLMDPGR